MKIAILGFGTVGQGVFDMINGAPGLQLGKVLVRPGKADRSYKCEDIQDIVSDPEIGLVAEAMGGIEPAYSYARLSLEAGKDFVTSNKALVAEKGLELAELAREKGRSFLFSAACGGAVPILHNLGIACLTDEIESAGGILNGTTNFMLDSMQRKAMDYSQALSEAQALGYAEADPTADVSGLDVLRKVMLISAVAYGLLPEAGLCREGIESISASDVAHFQSLGYCCRLIGSCGRAEGGNYAFVEPVLFKSSAPECSVLENYNMAKYLGKNSGPIVYMGQGAGRCPTASAVLRDISAIAFGSGGIMLPQGCRRAAVDNSLLKRRYYLRVDKGFEPELPMAQQLCEGRFVTEPVSCLAMHRAAAEIREKGGSIFFAAIED